MTLNGYLLVVREKKIHFDNTALKWILFLIKVVIHFIPFCNSWYKNDFMSKTNLTRS